MGQARVARLFAVEAPVDTVRRRIATFAPMYDLRLALDTGSHLEFKRGGVLGNLLSFDVHNVSTKLRIDLAQSGGSTSVTAELSASSLFQIFTSGDRRTLEQEMDALVSSVSAG